MSIIGIDCGASKIEFMLTADDIVSPQKVLRTKTPTSSYHKFFSTILENIKQLIAISPRPVTKIGIGVPGIIELGNRIIGQSSIHCLNGKNLTADLREEINIPILIENDANCFALCEARLGAAKNYQQVIGMIIGTGVAMGYTIDQELILGKHGALGEFGHWVIDPQGVKCQCGKIGCIETFISGKALERMYYDKTKQPKKADEIYQAYNQQDPTALLVIDGYLDRFGFCIAQVINIFDPDVIVLGGGISNIELLYNEGLSRVKNYVFSDACATKIIKNKLGDSSGIYGACLLT